MDRFDNPFLAPLASLAVRSVTGEILASKLAIMGRGPRKLGYPIDPALKERFKTLFSAEYLLFFYACVPGALPRAGIKRPYRPDVVRNPDLTVLSHFDGTVQEPAFHSDTLWISDLLCFLAFFSLDKKEILLSNRERKLFFLNRSSFYLSYLD